MAMKKDVPYEANSRTSSNKIPLDRFGDVSGIVNAVLFLASPMASYITGHVLNVNGGFYMG
jgi:3-oxoacyl-[acyl-carrier protein] reductase